MCDNCGLVNTFASLLKNTLTYLFAKLEIYDINDKRLPKILSDLNMSKEEIEVLGVFE